jgi:surface protein
MNKEMIIMYKKESKIKLFGENFIKNNRNNCIIMINNKIQEKWDYYNLEEDNRNDNIIVKLIEKTEIKDLSYMFYECESLLSILMESEWNMNHFTNLSYMFYNCISLRDLTDISNWNTSNVTNINNITYILI